MSSFFMSQPSSAYIQFLLKIAIRCYVAVLLCSALFVSPLISQTNFAHTHNDGSVIHLHSVQAILGSSLYGLETTEVWLEPTYFSYQHELTLQLTTKTIKLHDNIRAPPKT